jgi:hypothetical protein
LRARDAGAAVLVAALAASSGCSFMFSEGAPDRRETLENFACAESNAPPVLDTVGAGLLALSAAGNASNKEMLVAKETPANQADKRRQVNVSIGIATAFALIDAASAIYGYRAVASCQEARGAREVALSVFSHLHALSLRFHLDRRTGAVSRDLERGTTGAGPHLDDAPPRRTRATGRAAGDHRRPSLPCPARLLLHDQGDLLGVGAARTVGEKGWSADRRDAILPDRGRRRDQLARPAGQAPAHGVAHREDRRRRRLAVAQPSGGAAGTEPRRDGRSTRLRALAQACRARRADLSPRRTEIPSPEAFARDAPRTPAYGVAAGGSADGRATRKASPAMKASAPTRIRARFNRRCCLCGRGAAPGRR